VARATLFGLKSKMLAKIHRADDRIILAVCDNELIGKEFHEKGMQLMVSEHFYKGSDASEEKLRKLFRMAYIVNLVGEKSIKFALKEKLISSQQIISIQNIPHAEALIIRE
jgi:uncharacterized protein